MMPGIKSFNSKIDKLVIINNITNKNKRRKEKCYHAEEKKKVSH